MKMNRQRIRWAAWSRRIGYFTTLLAMGSTIYHISTERNIYYLAAYPLHGFCFHHSYTLAIVLWNISFVAISIGLGIPFIAMASRYTPPNSADFTEPTSHRINNGRFIWWISIAVCASLLYVNVVGYVYSGVLQTYLVQRHVWGWPLIYSACWLDPYGSRLFLDHYFSGLCLAVNIYGISGHCFMFNSRCDLPHS